MSDTPMEISGPFDPYLPMVMGVLRAILAALGGAGFTWALTVNASQLQMIVTSIMMLASAVLSIVQKKRANRALQQAADQPMGLPAPKLPAQ